MTGTTVFEREFRSGAEEPEMSASGTLAPGTYTLRLEVSALVDATQTPDQALGVGDVRRSYTLDLQFGDSVDPNPNPGPGPAVPLPPVPLPPAVWGGLLTLGGIPSARLRASRRVGRVA